MAKSPYPSRLEVSAVTTYILQRMQLISANGWVLGEPTATYLLRQRLSTCSLNGYLLVMPTAVPCRGEPLHIVGLEGLHRRGRRIEFGGVGGQVSILTYWILHILYIYYCK